jgi:acetylornithine deacetylase/succinyl-diaminopimelate desuccinylase-like protein
MNGMEAALQYAADQQAAFVEDFKALLRIESISTLPEHRAEVLRAAQWVADHLSALGLNNVEILPTANGQGFPVVYADYLEAGDAPTVVFYGHYDVQPADPFDLWTSPPFDPTVRGENLYARGASDMKGQVVCILKAIEAVANTSGGKLPVNVKFLLEGEEEIGSPHLKGFLVEQSARYEGASFCLNADSGILAPDIPSITYAVRGLAYYTIDLEGPASDLHSGMFGGAVHNPAYVLTKLVAGMKDDQGRVTLPGFYDDVRPLSAAEREEFKKLPQDDAWWLKQTGAPALFGEEGYSNVERVTARNGASRSPPVPRPASARGIRWRRARPRWRSGKSGVANRSLSARAAPCRWSGRSRKSWAWNPSSWASDCRTITCTRPTKSSICPPGIRASRR